MFVLLISTVNVTLFLNCSWRQSTTLVPITWALPLQCLCKTSRTTGFYILTIVSLSYCTFLLLKIVWLYWKSKTNTSLTSISSCICSFFERNLFPKNDTEICTKSSWFASLMKKCYKWTGIISSSSIWACLCFLLLICLSIGPPLEVNYEISRSLTRIILQPKYVNSRL